MHSEEMSFNIPRLTLCKSTTCFYHFKLLLLKLQRICTEKLFKGFKSTADCMVSQSALFILNQKHNTISKTTLR